MAAFKLEITINQTRKDNNVYKITKPKPKSTLLSVFCINKLQIDVIHFTIPFVDFLSPTIHPSIS